MSKNRSDYPEDMVMFELPDGSLVSNDPRFAVEELRQRLLEATPHTGVASPDPEEQRIAQNPDQEALERNLQNASNGRSVQVEDARLAEDRGLVDSAISGEDVEPPVDINEKIREHREEKAEEEPPAAGTPYDDWTPAQLRKAMNDRGLSTKGLKKKDAVKALEKDDAEKAGTEPPSE